MKFGTIETSGNITTSSSILTNPNFYLLLIGDNYDR